MGVPTYDDSINHVLDTLVLNVSTDNPVSTAERLREYNRAYKFVWDVSGGSQKSVAAASAWTESPTSDTTGKLNGILTDINEILNIWATTTAGSTGGGSGDVPLSPADPARIAYLRKNGGVAALGTFATPKLYSVQRKATTTAADIGKLLLDVWPGVSGYYFPIKYKPTFTPLGGTGSEVPDLTDAFAADLELVMAWRLAPRYGRTELVPQIVADMSEVTREALNRRLEARQDAKQDDAVRA